MPAPAHADGFGCGPASEALSINGRWPCSRNATFSRQRLRPGGSPSEARWGQSPEPPWLNTTSSRRGLGDALLNKPKGLNPMAKKFGDNSDTDSRSGADRRDEPPCYRMWTKAAFLPQDVGKVWTVSQNRRILENTPLTPPSLFSEAAHTQSAGGMILSVTRWVLPALTAPGRS